ncbi:TIGR03790 family protein [Roseibacillus ishigakijimensis]|uniref:TIGR03790 family protein n=1 Tax=Roseibacillus ishigakijimensis TaxID=454146 RepID=A0A934RR47_9BACT|nr:TIGR03790 family protein [Roseibacillus ishigakijimensis]MBK1834372.1 TIGR03790 family protein [Roseibacillus ishigakijimensis]
MKRLLSFSCLFLLLTAFPFLEAAPAPIDPATVAIIFNSNEKKSQALAVKYAQERNIPFSNLVPLDVPDQSTLSRTEFEQKVRDPLTGHFEREIWWSRARDGKGVKIPVKNKIRVLLLVKGVPYRIKREERSPGADGKVTPPAQGQQDEASVDSELVYLGLSKHEISGPLNNPYFKQDKGIADPTLTPLFFTCRLDGPSYEICERIITDSLAAEETGLWGMCYLDEAHKGKNYEIGDQWLRAIARRNRKEGIPTVVDRFRDTMVTNYPMAGAALYFGWYAHHRNGPFLNQNFRFKKGAIAVHLHSFSAAQLENVNKNWVAPLLSAGAAATVGNVWEPYLTGTHHFDILHERLLQGYSLVEAAHMAIPVHSWQSLVIGDPLYRPFLVYNQPPAAAEDNKDYRAFRLGVQKWSLEPETLTVKLRSAAARMGSGPLYEALGLRLLEENKIVEAKAFFQAAGKVYPGSADKLRQTLHEINIHRVFGEKEAALGLIEEASERFGEIPEGKALIGLRNILHPPAPPAAQPKSGEKN